MSKQKVLQALIDPKRLAIMQTLLTSKEEMYLKEIAQQSKVAMASAYRILHDLAVAGIIEKREWKTSILYKSRDVPELAFLEEFLHVKPDYVMQFVNKIKSAKGVDQIILYESKGKQNLLIIGIGITNEPLQQAQTQIKQAGGQVSFLVLTPDQYEQMSKMGLYSGKKMVLK